MSIPRTLLLLAAIFLAGNATAPAQAYCQARIVTRTRQVALYSGLEKQLFQAIQKQDQASLQKLLADDFEQWSSAPDPASREEWLNAVIGSQIRSFAIRQMAARSFGNVDLVSFILQQHSRSPAQSGEFFVVDAWLINGQNRQLAVRYLSPLRSSARHGAPRPTGKD